MEVKRSSASRAPTHNEYNELPASSKPHILHCTKKIENLVQRCNIATWRWRHQKCHLQIMTDIYNSFAKRKTWHCKSVAKRIYEQKLESS